MIRAEHLLRLRRTLTGVFLWGTVLVVFVLAAALFLVAVLGIALLVAGVASWVHHAQVASAWARTLGGIGLIGASSGFIALGWLALSGMAPPLGDFARLRYRILDPADDGHTAASRALKFIAAIGFLLAVICLPFAAAIRVSAHGPWLGWGA